MDVCQVPSICLHRSIWSVVYILHLMYTMTDAQDSVTLASESSEIDREWFLYGSLLSLAVAFLLLMLFICVWFCPCSQSSSQSDQVDLSRRDGENEPYRGSMYSLYQGGAAETDIDKSTYELAQIESQHSRNGIKGNGITQGSAFLIGIKKLSDPSDKITTSDDKAVIESEIHDTIRHLSESLESDVTNGNTGN